MYTEFTLYADRLQEDKAQKRLISTYHAATHNALCNQHINLPVYADVTVWRLTVLYVVGRPLSTFCSTVYAQNIHRVSKKRSTYGLL